MSKISFPLMGDYIIPSIYYLSKIIDDEIIVPPPITAKTIELGTKYSPDFICTPFKYTLGTMIECLESGADTLIQLGGGCRYGYYAELQELILKDLGYKFKYINLVSKGRASLSTMYSKLNSVCKINTKKAIYYGLITILMIRSMDKIDDYIREYIGFEVEKGSFKKLKKSMLEEFKQVKHITTMHITYIKYKYRFKKLKVKREKEYLKVGIIGELYTIMEPYSNFNLEDMLSSYHISIKRFTNVWYLLFKKKFAIKRMIKKTKYVKYNMGADATDNICRTLYLCKHHYDGIIHIKASFCTPEIGAMQVISKISNIYNIPVIFLSYDSNTSEVGVKTRIEAFYDMIKIKKEKS